MNCFIKKTENNIFEEDAQYSEEYEKMLWMREARIRTFMQLELEACQEEIVWMIKCHDCEALNRPQGVSIARRGSTRRGVCLCLRITLITCIAY